MICNNLVGKGIYLIICVMHTGSSAFIVTTLSGYNYETKLNYKLLQMYLCRIRFHTAIPKISFNISTICINYQLKTLRESLARVTNNFLGDFGSLLPQFDLQGFQTVETLLSRYDQIPKFREFRSEEDGAHFSLAMKCGTFSVSHS